MRVTYIGPHQTVSVPALGLVAEHGVPIEVPDEAAQLLLEQETNWRREPTKPRSKRAASTEEDD